MHDKKKTFSHMHVILYTCMINRSWKVALACTVREDLASFVLKRTESTGRVAYSAPLTSFFWSRPFAAAHFHALSIIELSCGNNSSSCSEDVCTFNVKKTHAWAKHECPKETCMKQNYHACMHACTPDSQRKTKACTHPTSTLLSTLASSLAFQCPHPSHFWTEFVSP